MEKNEEDHQNDGVGILIVDDGGGCDMKLD